MTAPMIHRPPGTSLVTAQSARGRIATILRESAQPLPTEEVTRLCGASTGTVLNLLKRCPEFINVGTKRRGLWAWCDIKPSAVRPVDATPVWKRGDYTGERTTPLREGSQTFLECGSVEGGKWKPRTRPVIISAANTGV